MFKKYPIKSYLPYSVTAAILYSIVAFIFIGYESFRSLWMLFSANMIFGICIAAFIILYYKNKTENKAISSMVASGIITTVMGIIVSCIVCIILYFIVPADSFAIHHTGTGDSLHHAPPQLQSGARDQQLLTLIVDAVFGNFIAGSFLATVLSYTTKQNTKGGPSLEEANEPGVLIHNKA